MDSATEDRIVRLRKELSRKGFDAGAETIRVHLQRVPACAGVPAVSTIWRILVRRGGGGMHRLLHPMMARANRWS